jgi:hypothetical protein
MVKSFSFEAPKEYLNTSGSDLKIIETEYNGADTVWIYVDKDTGRNPCFVSIGDLPSPGDTPAKRAILLDSDNPNHIILMDMLKNSTGHICNDEFTEYLNMEGDIPEAPTFRYSYTTRIHQNTLHTYELKESVVDENNHVTYQWKSPHVTWKEFLIGLEQNIIQAELKLKDPIIIDIPAAVSRYQRYIAILKYARDNFADVGPWKIGIPGVHEI